MIWIPFMRSDGPAWTATEAVALIGDVRTVEIPTGIVRRRVLDARMTNPFRLELLVRPA